jgi:hypothetical protein
MTMSIKLTKPRAHLLAVATVSALAAALAVLSTASAQTAGTAQNAKNDMARCQLLYSTRSHYHANGSEPSAQDVQAEMALQDCRAGRYDAAIATLEGMLRARGIPVPQPEATAQSR